MSMESWDVDPAGSPLAADAVAIVGADCRFADVSGVDELWDALTRGRETDLADRMPARPAGASWSGRNTSTRACSGYRPVRRNSSIHNNGSSWECSWHALEHAGYDPGQVPR